MSLLRLFSNFHSFASRVMIRAPAELRGCRLTSPTLATLYRIARCMRSSRQYHDSIFPPARKRAETRCRSRDSVKHQCCPSEPQAQRLCSSSLRPSVCPTPKVTLGPSRTTVSQLHAPYQERLFRHLKSLLPKVTEMAN